ncbi:MAG: ABC transporter ATP-binding protein [Phycisphaerales bacterium]|jgi:ABC-2 type transport system ATP-binding protein
MNAETRAGVDVAAAADALAADAMDATRAAAQRPERIGEAPALAAAGPLGITCTGLRRRYGRVRALDGLDLVVPPGVAVGLVGRNGAGKSTLFRVILGLEPADEGTVASEPMLPRTALLARTGFVPDRLSAHDWMTVAGAIDFVAALQPGFVRRWSDELVGLLGLDRSKKVRALSRGMQARLAFVLGLSHRPGLVLLDEPLLGVDAVSHESILETLAHMRAELRSSMLVASHNPGDLARLTDRVAFIDRGRIVEVIATDELVAETKRIVLHPAPEAFMAPPETVHVARRDDAVVLTVRRFTRELAERVRALMPEARMEVVDLTIAEACTDRLRAMEVQS